MRSPPINKLLRVAILDDYQDVARRFGNWDQFAGRADVTAFHDHLTSEDSLPSR
jgi:hypothetical protein